MNYMTATNNHKCDMFCLWEDLDSRYKKCRNCIHSKESYEYPQKNNQVEIGIMGDDNWHLWRNRGDDMDYNEYKKWLEKEYAKIY